MGSAGDGARAIDEDDAPSYVLDEIDEALAAEEDDDDFELDLTAEAPLTTDSLQLFLNEAGRYPLLTAAEEVELAKRIERGDMRGEGADDHLATCGSSSRSPAATRPRASRSAT